MQKTRGGSCRLPCLNAVVVLALTGCLFLLCPMGAWATDPPDADGDLLPDAWELQYGLNPNDPTDANLDGDGDRLAHRDEFFAGANPLSYTAVSSLSERAILDLFLGKAFLYFWEQSRAPFYFTPDNANYDNPSVYSNNFNSISTTGFGIAATVEADDRGWVDHERAYDRLETLIQRAVQLQDAAHDIVGGPLGTQGNRHGYLYHFVDNNGFRPFNNVEISTVDHALFVAGALVAAQYYKGTRLESLVGQLVQNTDWNWLYSGTFLYQGWLEGPGPCANGVSLEGGCTLDLWNRYSELMILLFLAMGHSDAAKSIPPTAWDNLSDGTVMFPNEWAHVWPGSGPQNFAFVPNMPSTVNLPGYTNTSTEMHYIHAGSLHNHQYSHLYADFRHRRDRYLTDFFANSITATLANRQFAISLNQQAFPDLCGDAQPYETYGPNSWGLMAGIAPPPRGYTVLQPIVMPWDNFSPGNIAVNTESGTVVLSAALGSGMLTPRQALDLTRHLLGQFQMQVQDYDALAGRYGFRNAFNTGKTYTHCQSGHYPPEVIGLDLGMVAGAIDNHLRGLVWKMAMRHPSLAAGMQAAGFTTGAVEPFILNFDDKPPAPHEDANGGGQDPNSFGGSSFSFGSGSITYTWIGDPFPALPYGPQQWAQRISAQDNIDSGAFILLNNHSVSRWDRLSFWIRGDMGGEAFSVGLKDRVIDRTGNPLQATEVKLPISAYHPAGAITSAWTEVRIPLRDFADRGVRMTELDNLSFTNLAAGGGTITVDDIAFLGDEFKPSSPRDLAAATDGQMVTLTWTASPEADVVGYNVARSDDGGLTYTRLNALLGVAATFTDGAVSHQQVRYRVSAVDNGDPPNESVPREVDLFVNAPPVLDPIGERTVNEGELLTVIVSAEDPDGDPLTYTASPLPFGSSFNALARTFSWVPAYHQAGAYSVTFTASDGALSDQETVVILTNNVPNVLANPDFELDEQNWSFPSRGAIDASVFRSGAKAARLVRAGTIVSTPRVSIPSTRNYLIAAWIKTQNIASSSSSGGVRIRVQWYTSSGSLISSPVVVSGLQGTRDWTRYTKALTAPSRARKARLQLQVIGSSTTGTAWFDAVAISPQG